MKPPNNSITEPPTLTHQHCSQLFELAEKASKAILEIYHDEALWQAQAKNDDTPVTAADIKSSEILVAGLGGIIAVPVVSEEAIPAFELRSQWNVYWLIDPLDGTREFIHKTDEFVINIALMVDHQPLFGFLYQPTTGKAWWGGKDFGAFAGTINDHYPLVSGSSEQEITALGSRRSHWKGKWRDRLESAGYVIQTQSVGSALKFAYLAEGLGDIYPRLGPTSEWDTAAPQAILDATGGAICQWNGEPLVYGKEDTLNPHFVAVRDQSMINSIIGKLSED